MKPLKSPIRGRLAWILMILTAQLVNHESAGADVEELAGTFMRSFLFEDFALSPDGKRPAGSAHLRLQLGGWR
jgi:hypothetical protein